MDTGGKIIYAAIGAVIMGGSIAAAKVTFNLPQFCSQEPQQVSEITRDVSYYRQHIAERTEKVAQCQNDPGQLGNTANCVNASRAEFKESVQGNGSIPKLRVN